MKYPLIAYLWYRTNKSEIYSVGDKVTARQIVLALKKKGFRRVSMKLEHPKGVARHYKITATR